MNHHLEFCDLSADLDRALAFLARFSEALAETPYAEMYGGYGDFLWDYLGKRAALEHVFFERYLGNIEWDELKLKAEIWRIRKILAKAELLSRSENKPTRGESNR